jgi:hypothetical protein
MIVDAAQQALAIAHQLNKLDTQLTILRNVAMDIVQWDFANEVDASNAVKEELAQTLSRGNTTVKKQFLLELNSQDLLAGYATLFPQYPLRARNLAHCMTLYWFSMWQAVRNVELPDAKAFEAVVAQCAARLDGDANAKRANTRQMMGEGMMYETIFAMEGVRRARAADSQAELQKIAATAHENCLKRGLNFKKMELSESGFSTI